jgi:hypothetical protein
MDRDRDRDGDGDRGYGIYLYPALCVPTHQMIQNLITNSLHHLKGLPRGNRVHDNIPMDTNEVLRVQDAVLILRVIVTRMGQR